MHCLLLTLANIHDIKIPLYNVQSKGSVQILLPGQQVYLQLLPRQSMNPPCCSCDAPAMRVCQHPQCSFPPFLCRGPCNKNASQRIHTHNDVQDFISFQEFLEKVAFTRLSLDPYVLHKQFLGDMKKKIILAKDHLQEQIHCLDKAYEQLQRYLCVDLQVRLTAKNQEMLYKIERDFSGESLTGRDLKRLFSGEKSEEEKKMLSSIEHLKEGFVKGLERIEQISVETMLINMGDMLMSQRERKQKSKVLCKEGMDLKDAKKFKEGLQKFQKALQYYSLDSSTYFYIGLCLEELDELDEAERSYKKSLELKPNDSNALNNIGVIHKKRNNLPQAIKWYNQAIKKDATNINAISNRADCYFNLKMYQQAMNDYSKALEMKPKTQKQIHKIDKIAKLMKNQK